MGKRGEVGGEEAERRRMTAVAEGIDLLITWSVCLVRSV
jgi:hypothetical protein